jgi:hypothetical protein
MPHGHFSQPKQAKVYARPLFLAANFHEKALFFKSDVAAPLRSSATALCPSRWTYRGFVDG